MGTCTTADDQVARILELAHKRRGIDAVSYTHLDVYKRQAWVFPEEGSVLSVDCMTIPAASEHQEAAEMFINFMCETDIRCV